MTPKAPQCLQSAIQWPILFSGPMVRAILDGRKTQTRRVVKHDGIVATTTNAEFRARSPYPLAEDTGGLYHYVQKSDGKIVGIPCSYGKPGDRLWVRETWYDDCALPAGLSETERKKDIYFRADGEADKQFEDYMELKWRPSIFMPRWASRITLEIVSVRVERLQEISVDDIVAEGVEPENDKAYPAIGIYTAAFADSWDSIKGKKHPWASNPWVWVIEFKRTEQ